MEAPNIYSLFVRLAQSDQPNETILASMWTRYILYQTLRTSCANSGRRGDKSMKKSRMAYLWATTGSSQPQQEEPYGKVIESTIGTIASLDNAFTRHPVVEKRTSESVIAIGAASYGTAFPVPTISATHQNGMPIDLSPNGDVTVLDTPLSGSHAKAWQAVEVVREIFNARDLDAIVVKDNTGGDWVSVNFVLLNYCFPEPCLQRHHVPTSNEEEFEEKEESPHNVEILSVSVHIPSIAGMTQDPTPHCSAPPAEYSLPSQYPHNLIRGVKAIEYTSKEISVDFDEALYAFKVFECNWTKFLDDTDPGREIKRGNQVIQDTWRRYLEDLCGTQQKLTIKHHPRAVP
ncbi:hypothetical protein F5877DRAFT_64694 [Lentinula edodes]|nr:hypothetical protein F5877DRAFT_64694 [Lentinula edodes]